MRRGELFALRKSDVDLRLGTILIARSNARDTTKGGHADLIPIAAPLFLILKHQVKHAPGSLVFPAPNGAQRSEQGKTLRRKIEECESTIASLQDALSRSEAERKQIGEQLACATQPETIESEFKTPAATE